MHLAAFPPAWQGRPGVREQRIVRIMFPKSKQSEHTHLTEISWDEFFDEFEKRHLALVYEEDSMFSKLVSRTEAH